MAEAKHILLIIRSAPYGDNKSRESLDIALAAGAFEQNISLLFMADGVFNLQQQQNPELLGQKSLAKTLKMLPLYDIEHIYFHQQDFIARGINTDSQWRGLCDEEIKELIAQQDVVISL